MDASASSPAKASARAGAAACRQPGARRLRGWKWVLTAIAVLAGVTALTALSRATDFGWSDFQALLGRLPVGWTLALMAVLPLTGFSVVFVYLIAGARFGPVLGGVVVAGVTAVHLTASHFIARGVFRRPIARLLKRRGHVLPRVAPDARAPAAVMMALMPGLPYSLRNYLLPLSGVPLSTYFWICLPIYVARSYVTIALGDQSDHLSVQTLLVLAGILGLKLAVCGLILLRLRRRSRPVFLPDQT